MVRDLEVQDTMAMIANCNAVQRWADSLDKADWRTRASIGTPGVLTAAASSRRDSGGFGSAESARRRALVFKALSVTKADTKSIACSGELSLRLAVDPIALPLDAPWHPRLSNSEFGCLVWLRGRDGP
jgi:hypothetical protein